jgi:MoaA/NifB/PqqE/SkfB family radical SAM enzyme
LSSLADQQNDALIEREDAAHQRRNWVRLSYDCNNHCTFCLDSNAHDGTMRGNFDIKVQIIEGRKRGLERLILSGGEPTMHPNFLDFVKLGKRAGYPRVQTVTNGRMFRYPEFLTRAADNGLDEITFSLHGHTAKLHDALVGTPGAFEEEVAGLRAALDSHRFIVNVDIVINKQNVRHLAEMLETFYGWGVREFDLLQVIPFGNAWTQARDHLFYDLEGNLEHLQRAFAIARRPDVHVWLNRFPPAFAEGFEDLIQDPYKLNDEVRGRREELDRVVSHGVPLPCRERERCKRCYLEGLCDGLDAAIATSRAPDVDVLRFEGVNVPAGRLPRAPRARLVADSIAIAKVAAARVEPREIELELASFDDLELSAFEPKRVVAVIVSRAEDVTKLTAVLPPDVELRVLLSRETAAALRALPALPSSLVLSQPTYDRVTDASSKDVDLVEFFAGFSKDVPTVGIPACLSGRAPRPSPRVLDVAMLGADARVDVAAYTRRFVAEGFVTKALRCGGCSANTSCEGVHVNWVRAHGFGALSPLA